MLFRSLFRGEREDALFSGDSYASNVARESLAMNQDLHQDDRGFVSRAKQVLDRAVGEMDQPTTLRLQRGRLAAIEYRPRGPSWIAWVSGLAVASVAALAVYLWIPQPASQQHVAVSLEDFELVTSVENVELAEDLEFFHWLADDDTTG